MPFTHPAHVRDAKPATADLTQATSPPMFPGHFSNNSAVLTVSIPKGRAMLEHPRSLHDGTVTLDENEPKERRQFVHPLAALVTISLDWFWATPDLIVTVTIVGLLITGLVIFVITAMTVTTIQLLVDRDSIGSAVAKGIGMG